MRLCWMFNLRRHGEVIIWAHDLDINDGALTRNPCLRRLIRRHVEMADQFSNRVNMKAVYQSACFSSDFTSIHYLSALFCLISLRRSYATPLCHLRTCTSISHQLARQNPLPVVAMPSTEYVYRIASAISISCRCELGSQASVPAVETGTSTVDAVLTR